MKFHYIAIDGPIGVGKTALVERLAERLDATTLLEEWGQNPFLKGFYDGAPGAAVSLASGTPEVLPKSERARARLVRIRPDTGGKHCLHT